MILSFDQLWKLYPNITLLHPDSFTYIVTEQDIIPASAVIAISHAPSSLLHLKWCNGEAIFHPLQMHGQVLLFISI